MMCCPLQQTSIFGMERIQPVTNGKSHARLWFEQSWLHGSHCSVSRISSEPVQHFRLYGDKEKDSRTLQTFSARHVPTQRDTDSARIVKKASVEALKRLRNKSLSTDSRVKTTKSTLLEDVKAAV